MKSWIDTASCSVEENGGKAKWRTVEECTEKGHMKNKKKEGIVEA